MKLSNNFTDGNNFVLSPEEKNELISREPLAKKYIRRYIGPREFIQNKERYCLYLSGANPQDLKKCPTILKRVEAVKVFRENSTANPTREKANTPTLYFFDLQPNTNYLFIPSPSSERGRYIPIGYLSENVVAGNAALIIADAEIYHFGVLTSNVHNTWIRATCGSLGNGYRYSVNIVYNNFPWPTPTEAQKAKIEKTTQAILDARELYPESSLADLYDPLTMPKELLRAHRANDKAVMSAYGWKPSDKAYQSESECVAELMKMYQKLTEKEK